MHCKYCKDLPNGIYFDSHTGDEVCTMCGLVLMERLPLQRSYIGSSSSSSTKRNAFGCADQQWAKEVCVREFLADRLTVLNLPLSPTIDVTLHLFEKIIDKNESNKNKVLDYMNIHHRPKLASALVEALKRAGTPRLVSDIAMLLETNPSSTMNIDIISDPIKPSDQAITLCDFMHLPYDLSMRIKKIVQSVEETLFRSKPSVLIGATMLRFNSELPLRYRFKQITISNLCNVFKISSSSLRQTIHLIPKTQAYLEAFDYLSTHVLFNESDMLSDKK